MKQTNNYNCGSAAIVYFLKLHNIAAPPIDEISKATGCEPQFGTKPERIAKFLRQYLPIKVRYNDKKLRDKSIIIYLADSYDEESGHYAVITRVLDSCVLLFDPWSGKITTKSKLELIGSWRCQWYGNRWQLVAK